MNYSIYRVSLDMHDTSSQVMLNVKQGDSARKIHISLTDGGRPYKITADCTARLRARTSNGAILFNDCDIKDNVIEYTLTNETCKNVGIVECEVTLYGADSIEITSARFSLIVEGVITSDGEIEATNEFTALTNALNAVDKIDASVSKVNDTTTISITKKDGTVETATVKDGANGKDGKEVNVTEFSSAIVGTAKGTTLSISDSANVNLRNLNVYGSSTQVGGNGKLECDVCGKNLIEPLMESSARNGITVTNNGDGSFTVDGTATSTAAFRLNQSTANGMDNLKPYKGEYCLSLRDATGNKNPQGLMLFLVQASDWKNYLGSATKPTADIDISGSFVYLHVEVGGSFSNFVIYPQLEVGSSMTNWEKPIMSHLEITLDNPLRVIPVTDPSLATYTDASGQMWCADEVDFAKGVIVRRITEDLNIGSETETPLTAEEVAAYKLLKTNYPNTTIVNDENAYMSAEYVIDTKTYIDNLVAKALGVASAELAEVIALQESYIGGDA